MRRVVSAFVLVTALAGLAWPQQPDAAPSVTPTSSGTPFNPVQPGAGVPQAPAANATVPTTQFPDRVPRGVVPYRPQPLALPRKPPLKPAPSGSGTPFDPEKTQEATPQPALIIPSSPWPSAPLSAAPTAPLRIDDAITLAFQIQPSVATAHGQLLEAEGNTISQRSLLLPKLSVSNEFIHRSTGSPSDGSPTRTVYITTDSLINGAVFNQLLFDFNHSVDLVKAADLNQQAAAAALIEVENDVALSVKVAFYTFMQDERLVAVAQENLDNCQQELKLSRALYQAGNMSPGDVVRSETTVSQAVLALNNARSTMEVARQAFVLAVGLPPRTPVQVVETIEPDLPSKEMDYLSAQAHQHRPNILMAERQVAAAHAQLDAAHTLNYPALTASAGITYQGLSNGVQYPTATAQLNLDFALYDGGQRAGAIRSAQGLLEVDQAALTSTELTVESEVSSVLTLLLTAERNVDVTRREVASGREGKRIAVGRYQANLGTITDVLVAQAAYVTALQDVVNSVANLSIYRAQLRHALATPFEQGFYPSATDHTLPTAPHFNPHGTPTPAPSATPQPSVPVPPAL